MKPKLVTALVALLALLAAACDTAPPAAPAEQQAAEPAAMATASLERPAMPIFQHPFDRNDPVMKPAWKDPVAIKLGLKADGPLDYRASYPELFAITAPPANIETVRPMTEYEEMQALVIAYPSSYGGFGSKNAAASVAQIIRHAATVAEVWVVTDSTAAQAPLKDEVLAAGLDEATFDAQVKFFVNPKPTIAGVDGMTVWFIDYGPMPIVDTLANTYAFGDFRYYPPRAVDDGLPTYLGRHLVDSLGQVGNTTTYRVPMSIEGGTFQATSDGTCFTGSRALVYMSYETGPGDWSLETAPLTELQTHPLTLAAQEIWGEYLGCKEVVILHSITDDGTGHIDMFMKVASDDLILIGDYPEPFQAGVEGVQAQNKARMDGNAAFLEGMGFKVKRVVMPGHATDGTDKVPFTYLNSTLINGLNIWPAFTFPEWEASRDQALADWQDAMPDYEHVWVDCEQLSYWSGAVHCITRTIPAAAPGLWVADGTCGEDDVCAGPEDGYSGACHPNETPTEVCWGPEWLCLCNDCTAPCPDPDAPVSCAGYCGGEHPAGCYCDATCVDYGDCCADVCEACGLGCGTTPTGCGDIAGIGCCEGSTLKFCNTESNLIVQDCGSSGCGWEADPPGWEGPGYYECGFSGADPSGDNPIACPGSTCTPACGDKVCGPDGCDGTCGACGAGTVCDGGACVDAGCGPDVGCPEGYECKDAVCVEIPVCVPSCGDKVCGPDGCEGSCGACGSGTVCDTGACVDAGCGPDVGCPEGYECKDAVCVEIPVCTPHCEGKACGPDDCGGSCGACGAGTVCNADTGACVDAGCATTADCPADHECKDAVCVEIVVCTPQCTGKVCGPDDCGGSCGTCAAGTMCSSGACVDAGCTTTADCAAGYECEDSVCVEIPVVAEPDADAGSTALDGSSSDIGPDAGTVPVNPPSGKKKSDCSAGGAQGFGPVMLVLALLVLGALRRRLVWAPRP